MSQEPIPEPTDSDSQALPSEGTNISDSEDVTESATRVNEDIPLTEDVWEEAISELVEIENNTQPIASAEMPIEKVAELAAESLSPRRSSRVASSARIATNQSTNWQRFQRYWQAEIRPALKEQTIKTLKAAIRSLESLVNRLEAQPASTSPQQPPTPWRQLQGIWGAVLGLTRSLLPRSLRQLSNPLLSGAIVGVLLLTLWTTSSLIFSQPPIQVATAPPAAAPAKPINSQTDNTEKLLLTSDQPVMPSPDTLREPVSRETAPQPRPKQTLLTSPSSEKTPDVIINDANPAPSQSPLPKPTPPPLKLTPEQTLIARIQDQVTDVSNQYVNGLIQSVQANFRSSLLTVKVGDDWYTLEQSQQNKLAQEMLKRAQQLDFVKLELTDSAGDLLARSPVVGSEMVILKRITAVQQIT